METLFVAWQSPSSRTWHPVGRLSFDGKTYEFMYTKGAASCAEFVPFGQMVDLKSRYLSEELFPLFANRLLPKSRPEYRDYLRWLNLDESDSNPIATLSRSGGTRGTDSLEVFRLPKPTANGRYEVVFFNHGLRYLSEKTLDECTNLTAGDRLYLMFDVQNDYDPLAIALRRENPAMLVGYCPRYLASEFRTVYEKSHPEHVDVTIEKINLDAPFQLRMLCKFSSPWPLGFSPFSSVEFEPIAEKAHD